MDFGDDVKKVQSETVVDNILNKPLDKPGSVAEEAK